VTKMGIKQLLPRDRFHPIPTTCGWSRSTRARHLSASRWSTPTANLGAACTRPGL
jgi:hypothetical protein